MSKFSLFIKKIFKIEIIALVVSFFAIMISVQENKMNRNFYELSVTPILKVLEHYDDNGVGVSIENFGLGVALVDSVQIFYDRERVQKDAMLEKLSRVNDSIYYFEVYHEDKGILIKEDEKIVLFGLRKTDENPIVYTPKYASIL